MDPKQEKMYLSKEDEDKHDVMKKDFTEILIKVEYVYNQYGLSRNDDLCSFSYRLTELHNYLMRVLLRINENQTFAIDVFIKNIKTIEESIKHQSRRLDKQFMYDISLITDQMKRFIRKYENHISNPFLTEMPSGASTISDEDLLRELNNIIQEDYIVQYTLAIMDCISNDKNYMICRIHMTAYKLIIEKIMMRVKNDQRLDFIRRSYGENYIRSCLTKSRIKGFLISLLLFKREQIIKECITKQRAYISIYHRNMYVNNHNKKISIDLMINIIGSLYKQMEIMSK